MIFCEQIDWRVVEMAQVFSRYSGWPNGGVPQNGGNGNTVLMCRAQNQPEMHHKWPWRSASDTLRVALYEASLCLPYGFSSAPLFCHINWYPWNCNVIYPWSYSLVGRVLLWLAECKQQSNHNQWMAWHLWALNISTNHRNLPLTARKQRMLYDLDL